MSQITPVLNGLTAQEIQTLAAIKLMQMYATEVIRRCNCISRNVAHNRCPGAGYFVRAGSD